MLDIPHEHRELASAAPERLFAAASRDNKLSGEEEDRLRALAEALRQPIESTDVASDAFGAVALGWGLRVCFTGSPNNESERHPRKPSMRAILKQPCMTETDSEIRSGYDPVVAFDTSRHVRQGKAGVVSRTSSPIVEQLSTTLRKV